MTLVLEKGLPIDVLQGLTFTSMASHILWLRAFVLHFAYDCSLVQCTQDICVLQHTEAEAHKLLSSLDEAAMLRLQPRPDKQWIMPFRKANVGAVEKILLTYTTPEALLYSLKREDFPKYLQMHDLSAKNMPKAVCVQTILTAWQDAGCEDQKQIWTV